MSGASASRTGRLTEDEIDVTRKTAFMDDKYVSVS